MFNDAQRGAIEMAWTVWGQNYQSGELSDTSYSQAFRMNSNTIVRAIRTWFVIYNNPIFNSLNAKIYATDEQIEDGSYPPTKLLATSNSRTKSELITDDYGIKETYFDFTNDVELEGTTWYAIVINADGYSPTSNSHIAWKHSYPDPVLPGYTAALETINQSPFEIYFIGADY